MHVAHLSKDKTMRRIMQLQDTAIIEKRNHIHLRLCASIISQQLSTRVAEVIYARFLALFRKRFPSPQDILAVDIDELRGIGLSGSKTNYIRNVCDFFIEHKLTDKAIHKMSDEDIIDLLVQIKGVGKWTVEMLLMFTLGREDVFAVDDLVIQQTMVQSFGIDTSDKKQMRVEMLKIAERWRPFRTYACKYLWGMRDSQKK